MFPATGPDPDPHPQLVFTGPGPQFVFTGLGSQVVFACFLQPKFVLVTMNVYLY